jgi:hypothetical protein
VIVEQNITRPYPHSSNCSVGIDAHESGPFVPLVVAAEPHGSELETVLACDPRQRDVAHIDLLEIRHEGNPPHKQHRGDAAADDCQLAPTEANRTAHLTLDTIPDALSWSVSRLWADGQK